ncbi:MAG: glycolate oxidase subunit GlcE [Gallionellaceae bacterium]|nr:glycolate oxidase subunit GlcE [Gallionellaceae bacterium]
MKDTDISAALQATVQENIARRIPLKIVGGNSKAFYGRSTHGEHLSVANHCGVINYEPTELCITARAGTPLADIEALLTQQGQSLPFEPPHFSSDFTPSGTTLGGAIASGLSGPRRPYAGSARDFVLGVKILNGKGEILSFGGQVIKNVAGFDVSRLMTGSMGTLGVLLEISLKVLPQPEQEQTWLLECDVRTAIHNMNTWAGQALPLSGAVFDGQHLYIRLSGSAAALRVAHEKLGGELFGAGAIFWESVRNHSAAFFQSNAPLWRLSVPAACAPLDLAGACFIDWGGAQRWLKTDVAAELVRDRVAQAGGHATLFRGGDHHADIFHPLSAPIAALHRRLKNEFDPHGIFNPGRMYQDY